MFDSSLDVICSFDSKGCFIEVSNACRQVWGYAPEELIGRPYMELVMEDDHEQTIEAATRITKGENMTNFENRYCCKDGRIVPMVWSAHWNEKEKVMFCIARDASQKKAKEELQSRYEKELYQQNGQMQEMLERITDGFFALDASFTITYWNTQAEVILGRKREEALGKNLWDIYPDIENTPFASNYKKALHEQVSVSFEAFFAPHDRWYEVGVHPSQGGISVFFRDVTEHKREEERRKNYEAHIKNQNKQLVNILESTNDGFIAVDTNWKVTYWNRQAEIILGTKRQEALGNTFWDILPKGIEKDHFFNECHRALSQGVAIEFENYTPQYKIWFENRIYPSNDGLYIFFQNIDEKKQAETELQRLSLVAKETENAVVFITPDRKTTWVNAAFTRMTGYAPEEVIGNTPAKLLEGPGTDPVTVKFIHEQYKTEKPFQVEILNYKKSGEPFWSELHIQPLFDATGKLEQFFSLRKDITKRKALEKELEVQQKKTTAAVIAAQEKERAQVSLELHDNVNQVLTTIKLYMELCRDGVGNTQEILERSIGLMQESITEIRSLSKRLSAPSLGNIKLQESIKDLLDTVAATGKLVISLDMEDMSDVDVNQEVHLALYRILQEHLTNILKHAKAQSVQVILQDSKGTIQLVVIDDGQGFDIQRKRNGIGITNMITRAENSKGMLSLNSAPGCGCELKVSIPRFG
ncbi:MAG: hypothetical protein JWP69_1239 [Flaviaesturariibacter sp.]|nr:hypothetical protein [Flaviaesturariibacter sp.]